ncbi:F-box/LRR-repeat protein [Dirofilaria immitis]
MVRNMKTWTNILKCYVNRCNICITQMICFVMRKQYDRMQWKEWERAACARKTIDENHEIWDTHIILYVVVVSYHEMFQKVISSQVTRASITDISNEEIWIMHPKGYGV